MYAPREANGETKLEKYTLPLVSDVDVEEPHF